MKLLIIYIVGYIITFLVLIIQNVIRIKKETNDVKDRVFKLKLEIPEISIISIFSYYAIAMFVGKFICMCVYKIYKILFKKHVEVVYAKTSNVINKAYNKALSIIMS